MTSTSSPLSHVRPSRRSPSDPSSHNLAASFSTTTTTTHRDQGTATRLAPPRMLTSSSELLNCSVHHVNTRQFVADIPQLPDLDVWLQRPKVIVPQLVWEI